jgi:prephenate dehydrogenase
MNIAIVGLGLIGGSLAKDLRAFQMLDELIGVELNPSHQKLALELGLVDCILELKEACERADVIFLSAPISSVKKLLPIVLEFSSMKLVIDLCSTKKTLVHLVENHPNRACYLAAHPMSGTEFSGPQAAISGLFQGKNLIVCDTEKTDKEKLELGISIFQNLGMKIQYMTADEHDLLAAQVSHLSHVTSFSLAMAVIKLSSGDFNGIKKMAAGGFHSTVRLAKSDPELWNQIFTENKENVLDAIDAYLTEMRRFRDILEKDDTTEMLDFMKKSNQINRLYES